MRPVLLGLVFVIISISGRAHADSISCDRGIVSSGDGAVDLLMKCGEPEWKDSWTEEVTEGLGGTARLKTMVTVEEWTYNFGPQQFLRIVTLRNGVVAAVRTGTYGAAKDREPAAPRCGDRIISTGDSKADVLLKCGEPFYRSSHQEELRDRFDGSAGRSVWVTVEEWTYNFGPQQFLRIITFRNGRVVDIRTGTYGR